MGENLVTSLEITVIGMTLVFGAIQLLWGVMTLLMRLTADRDDVVEVSPDSFAAKVRAEDASGADAERERKQRAAAVAVAVALAREEDVQPHEFPLPPTAIVSAWQSVMRGRTLQQKGPKR